MQLISCSLSRKAGLYADLQRQQGQASPRKARPCQPPDQVPAAFFKGLRHQPAMAASLAKPLQHHGRASAPITQSARYPRQAEPGQAQRKIAAYPKSQ
jgi:hypothetical protein